MTFEYEDFTTVVFSVRTLADFNADVVKAYESGVSKGYAEISFPSPESLWNLMTEKRWEILKTLSGAGSLSIREVARRVGRDIKAVHADVTKLINNGVIDRAPDGGVVFPYDTIHVDYTLHAAA